MNQDSNYEQFTDPDNVQVVSGDAAALNFNQHLTWRNPFLIAFVAIFIAVGLYLLLSSSADTVNSTKVWDTAADWNGGTLSDTVVSGNSLGLLAQAVAPVSTTPSSSSATNLALNRPAYASSTNTGNNNTKTAQISLLAKYVDDGSLTTRWGSKYSDPQWIYVDLGKTYSINEVKLSWETAYAKAYEVQVSNNARQWTTIYSTSSGTGGVNDLTGLQGTGRYVRMYGTERGTQWGYSLWEMAVYGPATTTTPPPTPTVNYDSSGSDTLTYDASTAATWTSLTGLTTLPSGTSVSYQARTSSNDSTWSSWNTVPSTGSLSALASSRYIQVQADLSTTVPASTPVLNQLTLSYGITIANPTASLSAASSTITAGSSTTLTWTSSNATSCTASGSWSGAEATSGSTTVSPTATSTYDLSCTGAGGTVSASPVTVTVTPASTSGTGSSSCGSSGDTCLFNDEFTGAEGTQPTSDWIIYGTNDGSQLSGTAQQSASNVSEDGDGHLDLQITKSGSTYNGAFISTFTYNSGWPSSGPKLHTFTPPVHIEMTAEMPANTDAWPVLWSMQTNSATPIETDIAEEQMSAPTTAGCHMHQWSGDTDLQSWDCQGGTVPNMGSNFNTYAVDMYADKTIFYVNGNVIGTSPMGNPGPVGLILSSGLGGWLSSQTLPSGNGPWNMLVSDVKAWTIPND